MKNLMLFMLSLILSLSLSAQEEKATFSRKGKVLLEIGYNLTGRLGIGGGTRSSIEFGGSGGGALYNFSVEGGYFISDNFALKGRLGVFGRGNNSNGILTNFAAGGKYYLMGRIPAELTLGVYAQDGDAFFLGNARIGYGIPLAENINLEPFIGIVFGEDFDPEDTKPVVQFGLNFSMFL